MRFLQSIINQSAMVQKQTKMYNEYLLECLSGYRSNLIRRFAHESQ